MGVELVYSIGPHCTLCKILFKKNDFTNIKKCYLDGLRKCIIFLSPICWSFWS